MYCVPCLRKRLPAPTGPVSIQQFNEYQLVSLMRGKAATVARPHTVADKLADDPETECIACLTHKRRVVNFPCGHAVTCFECAARLKHPERCELCQDPVRVRLVAF